MAELFSSGDSSSGDGWDTDDSCTEETGRLRAPGEIVTPRNSALIGGVSALSAMSGPPRGSLRLDKTHARVGEVVGVFWDIPSVQTSAGDWIAVYESGMCFSLTHKYQKTPSVAGEEDIEQYLDYRLRGESQDRHGHVTWTLDHAIFEESQ